MAEMIRITWIKATWPILSWETRIQWIGGGWEKESVFLTRFLEDLDTNQSRVGTWLLDPFQRQNPCLTSSLLLRLITKKCHGKKTAFKIFME